MVDILDSMFFFAQENRSNIQYQHIPIDGAGAACGLGGTFKVFS